MPWLNLENILSGLINSSTNLENSQLIYLIAQLT